MSCIRNYGGCGPCINFSNVSPETDDSYQERMTKIHKIIFLSGLLLFLGLVSASYLMTSYGISGVWQLIPSIGMIALIPVIINSGYYLHQRLK